MSNISSTSTENKVNNVFEHIRNTFGNDLTPEQKKMYNDFAKNFYNDLDFFNSNTNKESNNDINLEEALASIVQSIKSGLHPKYITNDEERLLKCAYGEEWYKRFGYDSKEL